MHELDDFIRNNGVPHDTRECISIASAGVLSKLSAMIQDKRVACRVWGHAGDQEYKLERKGAVPLKALRHMFLVQYDPVYDVARLVTGDLDHIALRYRH